eukprot:m.322061 g.322061  ORF g.322061 m.322061 type:complete len:207 (+) comp26320_c0_seq1:53-673(+)
MYTYDIHPRAYAKLLCHAAKHPYSAVNGILLGRLEDRVIVVQDVIPLFHTHLNLTPMLEIGLIQIEAHCTRSGMAMVGYYHANKSLDDTRLSDTARRIAKRLCEEFKHALVLLVNNAKLGEQDIKAGPAVWAFTAGNNFEWQRLKDEQVGSRPECVCRVPETACSVAARLVHSGEQQLHDFESHLEDVDRDWENPHIDKILLAHSV